MGLIDSLPFLLQDELVRLGGLYSKGPDGTSHVVRDGALITGQNRDSAADAANTVLQTLAPIRVTATGVPPLSADQTRSASTVPN